MTYEVYVDELFIRNLWMNLLLLALTGWADHASIKKKRIGAAAAAGAMGACLMTVMSAGMNAAGFFLGEVLLAAGMTKLAFSEKQRFFIRFFLLYIECFALNGLLYYLEQAKGFRSQWLLFIGTLCMAVLAGMEFFLRKKRQKEERSCQVKLQLGSAGVCLKALHDTGNSLRDPVTGKPVSIVCAETLQSLLEASGEEKKPVLIPYHTISDHGLLAAYTLDYMELLLPGRTIRVEKPLIAKMPLKSGDYPMILHKDLLPSSM